jgi:hypothetical protein
LRTIGGAIGVGVLGALLAWGLASRLALASTTPIDVVAALRPETHAVLSAQQLALVQANLGTTLRDIYLLMMILALCALVCAFWLPDKEATLSHSRTHEREATEDEGLAVTASEF